MDIVDLLQECC